MRLLLPTLALSASLVLTSGGLRTPPNPSRFAEGTSSPREPPPLAGAEAAPAEPKAPETNVVFRGATIYDGAGGKPSVGDVHVKGDKIAAVGKVGKVEGATEIDAGGLVICPGFIDLHTHCDSGLTGKTGRLNKNYVTQGCTTVVTGNCGSGPVDVAKYFATSAGPKPQLPVTAVVTPWVR